MDLICEKCGETLGFGEAALRPMPVERGDAQAFQIRRADGAESVHVFQCARCGGIRAKTSAPTDPAWTAQTFASTKLFTDPTPNGQINMRVLVTPFTSLDFTDLSDDEKQVLLNTLVLLSLCPLAEGSGVDFEHGR